MTSQDTELSREEIAKREIGHTDISPGLARVMTFVFLLMIAVVPICQYRSILQNLRWSNISTELEKDGVGLFSKCFAANAEFLKEINIYEDRLKDESVIRKKLLGPTQLLMLRLFGQGNEKVYPGNEGWLFFRPDVDYVTGPGFLEKWVLKKRRLAGNEYTLPPEPDPRKTIVQFHSKLKKQGITLIVVPVPGKASIHPEFLLASKDQEWHWLQNESFDAFKREMEAAGVTIIDPVPILEKLVGFSGMPQYLKGDTHWKPGTMEVVAKRLADYIEKVVDLQPRQPIFKRRPLQVSHVGDLVLALNLPADQQLLPKENVSIRQVYDKRSGNLWSPARSAEILLLGDSFSNIYSLDAMQWGESAGFAEQISFFLQRPVDAIIQNDDGAYATRQVLSQQLERDPDRLTGKKVVIWQFAARELYDGDWKKD